MMAILINAEKAILGRMATEVAKKALLGEEIIIVNAEKAVISGKRENIIKRELKKMDIRNLGNPRKGPFYNRKPDRYVRRAIRGMLPWKKPKGREAFKRVMVYEGLPQQKIFKSYKIKVDKEKIITLEKKKTREGMQVGELCNFISRKKNKEKDGQEINT